MKPRLDMSNSARETEKRRCCPLSITLLFLLIVGDIACFIVKVRIYFL